MNSEDSITAATTPAPNSLLAPRRLLELLLLPRVYFSNKAVFQDQRAAMVAALLAGVVSVMGKIDEKMVRADLTDQGTTSSPMLDTVTSSWFNYWMIVICFGLIGAVFTWFLGGWWYKKRLQWSGAQEVTPHDARRAHVLAEQVYTIPALVLALFQTVAYPNYGEAWNSDNISAMVALVFVFWSCWTSFCAASSAFPVKKDKAMVWFLILPVVFYGLFLGGFTMLYAALA